MAKTSTMAVKTFVDGDGVVHVNDIFLSSGQIAMSSGKEAYATIIECAVRTRLGELPLDIEQGIPYFETVFQSSRLTSDFEAELRSRISGLPFVEQVTSLTTDFDRERGSISYTATIQTTDGDDLTVSNSIGSRTIVSDIIGTGGGSMNDLIREGRFYLPVHKANGVQYYRILTDDTSDPDNGVQPAISNELFRKNPQTGAFEEVQQEG